MSVLPAYFVFGVFLIGVATAENLETVMLCRFFAGLMASASISNVAGSWLICGTIMIGLWPLLGESIKSSLTSKILIAHSYSIAVIGGPTVGPLIGSAITNSYSGWRWTEYITSFLIFLLLVIDVVILPETYAVVACVRHHLLDTADRFKPVLLQRKASHLRKSSLRSKRPI